METVNELNSANQVPIPLSSSNMLPSIISSDSNLTTTESQLVVNSGQSLLDSLPSIMDYGDDDGGNNTKDTQSTMAVVDSSLVESITSTSRVGSMDQSVPQPFVNVGFPFSSALPSVTSSLESVASVLEAVKSSTTPAVNVVTTPSNSLIDRAMSIPIIPNQLIGNTPSTTNIASSASNILSSFTTSIITTSASTLLTTSPSQSISPAFVSNSLPTSNLTSSSVSRLAVSAKPQAPLSIRVSSAPSTAVINQSIINNIINMDTIQKLLRQNPGQPITIIRMPETVPSQTIPTLNVNKTFVQNSVFSSIDMRRKPNEILRSMKTRRETGRVPSMRGRGRGRKSGPALTKKAVETKVVDRPLVQVKTRSGRVSKPPPLKDYVKTGHGEIFGEDSRKFRGDQKEVRSGVGGDQGGSDSKENDGKEKNNERQENSSEAVIRGGSVIVGVNGVRRRGRGRLRGRMRVNHSRESLARTKLKEHLLSVTDDEVAKLAIPRIASHMSPWDYLVLTAHKNYKLHHDKDLFDKILEEFKTLHEQMKALSSQLLQRRSEDCILQQSRRFEVSAGLSAMLNQREGSYVLNEHVEPHLPDRVLKLCRDIDWNQDIPQQKRLLDQSEEMDSEHKRMKNGFSHSNKGQSSAEILKPSPIHKKNNEIANKILGVESIFPDKLVNDRPTPAVTIEQVGRESDKQSSESGSASDISQPDAPRSEESVNESLTAPAAQEDSYISSAGDRGTITEADLPCTILEVPQADEGDDPSIENDDKQDEAKGPQMDEVSEAETLTTNIHVSEDGISDTPLMEGEESTTLIPQNSTITQLADGSFLVQRADGSAVQIQAPEGMTLETIQALLTMETEVFDQGSIADGDTVIDDSIDSELLVQTVEMAGHS